METLMSNNGQWNDLKKLIVDFKILAHYFCAIMDGDTYLIDNAYQLLKRYSLVDEDGFEIDETD